MQHENRDFHSTEVVIMPQNHHADGNAATPAREVAVARKMFVTAIKWDYYLSRIELAPCDDQGEGSEVLL